MLNKTIVQVKKRYPTLCIVACGLALTACGGGGGGGSSNDDDNPRPQTNSTGVFIDSAVEGLAYSTDNLAGETDNLGTYTYETGKPITFSIGGVSLGSATGAGVLTPLDLVGGDSTSTEAQNLVRFLLMLDEDSDPENGIYISEAVRAIASTWTQVDFSTTNLDADLTAIMSDVASADARTPILPGAPDAKEHLEDSIACLTSGIFSGTFSGDDSGTYLMWIQSQRYDPDFYGDSNPRTGVTSALIYSNGDATVYGVEPTQGVLYSNTKQFVSGTTTSAAVYRGEIKDYNTFSNGLWENEFFEEYGSFQGGRKAGASNAKHRLSGFMNLTGSDFSQSGSALIGLDVFADDTVTGVMVSLAGTETTLSGNLVDEVIMVTGGEHSFSLLFYPEDSNPAGVLGGTSGFYGDWKMGSSTVGGVIGSSCKLN